MIKLEKLVLITSIIIAVCAASFSIYGIGLLFSGAALAAMIMAATLELGKLVTTSWLFKNWKIANVAMKIYMTFAIVVLMGITSLGVFGYLSSAYQKSALQNEMREEKIKTLETNIDDKTITIENYNEEINKLYKSKETQEKQLTETLNNALITRNPIQLQNIQNQINSSIEQIDVKISEISEKIDSSNQDISNSNQDILNLKIEQSEQKDITTFKFVAEEFNTGINEVAKWFIFVIIGVFDPLAVVLLMAANMSLANSEKKVRDQSESKKIQSSQPSNPLPSPSPINISEIPEETKVDKKKETIEEFFDKNIKIENYIIREVERPVIKEVIKEIEKPIVKKQNGSKRRGMFSF